MSKKSKSPKPRNWLAVHAHFKTGAGAHGASGKKPKYNRKEKHKKDLNSCS
jgi:hypothetical protein